MTSRADIAEALGVTTEVHPHAEIQRRVDFLVEYATSIPGNRGFVLGISGGQDSTLAGKLCQLAVERLREIGHDAKFYAVRLPYGVQSDEDDAQRALSFIAPDVSYAVQIKDAVDATVESVASATGEPVTDFNKGNIKARQRMVVQYAIAGDRNLLVVGSDHAAEALTGYFTKFGDGAADVMPLSGLTKEQGRQLLRTLGADPTLIEKPPTADLLDEQPGDLDEDSLGVSYEAIDAFLTGEPVSSDEEGRLSALFSRSQHKRELPVTPRDDWWRTL
ncbi:ammonia-dependent NAD(+) synthetase [Leucobacter sp. UCMA 4100]|uniref:ammonia-dependent NAD(+) synthetase n=1 Tax=Leucobacter sp. UCMA 4100 TaxID=2810534 RepID=UPI0022EA63FC|nr:ammonia-dependent NAD(+) synthetase [Leucobacter sp. UCMA 4100]MDA3148119.1 ammonia-dependent NAD(+) synthetase [Leucobacter sp. UCMA 4100]